MGDACDPQPDVPKQKIVFFDPFTSVKPQWGAFGAQLSVASDALHVGSGGDTAVKNATLTFDYFLVIETLP